MTHKKLYSAAVIALLLLITGGCSIPERPELVAISNPPVFKPKTPLEIKTIEDAMAAIITITSQELGFPVVQPLYLHLYKDTAAFAAYAGGAQRLPHDVTGFALAVAEQNRFHINMERVRGRPWSALINSLAHEYTHNVEYLLSSQRGPQWIREGFANWGAAKVVHFLGWQDYSISLSRAEREARRQKALLPQLSNLEKSTDWANWANQPKGGIVTYHLAFVAVDRLIEKKGLAGMVNYFKSQDFQQSFGISRRAFETEFKSEFLEAKPAVRVGRSAERPDWRAGNEWRYAWKTPRGNGTIIWTVIGNKPFEGVPSYVVRVGRNVNFYTKDALGLLATMSKGELVSKRNPPLQYLAWPLETGKEWKSVSLRENLQQKSSQTFDYQIMVADRVEVKVPAGAFEAFRIEVYGSHGGNLVTERWYSPEVKWFVKSRDYLQEGPREEELVSFKVD